MKRRAMATFVFLLSLTYCASPERTLDDISTDARPTDNPASAITQLETDLVEGRSQNVDVLSPTWFASAEQSLQDAKELRHEGKDFVAIFRELAEGRAQLDRANHYATISRRSLDEVLKARADAQKAHLNATNAGATPLIELREDLLDADASFMELTEAIEEDDLPQVDRDRDAVIKEYQAVSIAFLQKEKLGTPHRVIEEAIRIGAEKYAPKSLAYAQGSTLATEQFIANNPKAREEIDTKAKDSQFYANRALLLTQQSKAFADRHPEETVLWVEQHLANQFLALGYKDQRDAPLDAQFETLRHNIHGLALNQRAVAQESKHLLAELKEAHPAVVKDTKFKEIASQFNPKEAEVLQSEGKVIIRLKGLKFPVGKASLGSENFALLSKVQEALGAFRNPVVTIEGHSDASGTAEANQALSKKRAETVKEYLVNSEAVSDLNVSAVGVGFDKPIASNKTREGRAMNRRVDLIVEMTATPVISE